MASQRMTPPWNFLNQASEASLESFELSRLNHAANLRKEIAALLEQWIEETAQAALARWLREDRKLLEASAPASIDILPAPQTPLAPPPPEPISVRPRHRDRRVRRSAGAV
jgi:hypothetical protein